MTGLSHNEILRYSRHLVMPEVTLAGQQRLKDARVLCVGAGGLGSPAALYLAAAGVGTLGLVEFDTVELTNIHRQILYTTTDIGRPKLEAARERLCGTNPEIRVVPHAIRLDSANVMEVIADYDIVVDGTDNFPTRYLVNDACVLTGKPSVYASIFRFEGQLCVFDSRHGPCYRCLFPEPPPPGLVPSCADGGVLGVLPGIVGSLQALEVLKLILGVGESLLGRLILFDALTFEFRELGIDRDPDCVVCGKAPSITAPLDYDEFCGLRADPADTDVGDLPTISVEAFAAGRDRGDGVQLLDVRAPHEYAIVSIPGATLLPLDELPRRLHELDPAQPYILSCHHGPRSVQAYHLLRGAGFQQLRILSGGIDAWAVHVDPSLPRY
jgi:molybdopterin/thiamine biosynthesis adenylyltransferase/rhodanese-related sulfurtransferase